MTEFLPGIYKVLQKTDRGNTTEINIFTKTSHTDVVC